MKILNGAVVAADILAHTATRAGALLESNGATAVLATVLVGDDPASRTYVNMKARRCEQVGIRSRRVELDAGTTTSELIAVIENLSADPEVNGILLQHPVPENIDERAAFDAITPAKDVDGVTTASLAATAFGGVGFRSCTPGGILRLLDAYDIEISGRRAVVVGRSPILGLPVGLLLLRRDATVTYCHSRTADLAAEVARADIVIAAAGQAELIRGSWITPGAVVIDAGYNAGNVGDVEFAAAADRASAITPVPGGVGPMTIAVLLEQTLTAAERQHDGDGFVAPPRIPTEQREPRR
ncbi:bifunctional 5,10-methylene-tetrahydrofolate dehydrogenase/5,10-methylene-tetrahydrofolate cyclohydrolase [Rhodococcus sp. 06-412-2C]|uniref:bifunctional 5,10-methylenetetrahydrofolate dehydrogenase/5,10-methenyltetrahydrofolate cyclohydrolase n=1 Tax=unclassified Rhodococcus (in: high G+C Gram-positive bacteria) TaxID=192944 RepID=UPI000B9BF31A|nr:MULTISPECIES: tetrahydrofolate dehydrogenase/cyclohydrolase catalytic domain-containing protein [unclassified Rhodococcus (in: high G+C Gram-positive bacteria)]OZC90663.1 bifunctional 5,10-methylene-tetrahydrofolate dehydrogenase/5,10-methylene-tetrahydrofolate cyclohydrolase [Rhodococcus sp. 06-412-2C]OZC98081.1 bifunctional 5,10-methylene-tetrahydrofolate dehydrogenase/5,10-methylene-tetrahydrofolate cyclohydrolase [Rhodococcus sp. 06-412-2B]